MTLTEPGPSNALDQAGLSLPGIEPPAARRYGARSDESLLVGDLLMRHVPALARGDVEIVAIARRVGVLSKVAVRRRRRLRFSARPASLASGLGTDYVNRVSAELGGERLHVLQWQGDPSRYIANALGLGYLPPIELWPSTRLANVFLGDIDVRGARGGHGVNLLLASALTEWRLRLREIARSPAWRALEIARQERRSVPATVQRRAPKGLAVAIYGLNGFLPTGQVQGVRRNTPPTVVGELARERLGQEIQVRVLRMDPDAGHIFVSERAATGRQLRLF